MYKALIALAAVGSSSSGNAQTTYPASLFPVVQDVPGRWIWRLQANSVLRVSVPGISDNALEFWMIGENRGTTGDRFAHVRISMDCASRRFVRERSVSRNAAGAVTDITVGDAPANWLAFAPGTSIDGARALLCPSR